MLIWLLPQSGKFPGGRRRGAVADAEIERLTEQVPLVSLAAAGVVLARTGADLAGRCPFHEDGTPSLVISPDRTCGIAWGRARRAGR